MGSKEQIKGGVSGDGASEEIPFPETDLSPTLQRTIKRKLDSGELDEVEREELLKMLEHAARPVPPDEES